MDIIDTLIAIMTNNRPNLLLPVLIGLAGTLAILWKVGGRLWAVIYVMMIPFLNWSFGVVPNIQFVGPWMESDAGLLSFLFLGDKQAEDSLLLHPLTMVTGLVFVVRDFVQREMRQWVLLAMALALAWSMYYAWIVIVIASGLAFFVSEFFDWLLFTFTKYRLSQRILISSAVAAPIDTTIFLYGADIAKQVNAIQVQDAAVGTWQAVEQISQMISLLGVDLISVPFADGNMLTFPNWIVFVIGKMIGAVVVSEMIKRRENAGLTDPYENQPAQSATV
ncbi:MAG: hypothetical protein AAGI14_00470 [Pseudomonadota bacterium]